MNEFYFGFPNIMTGNNIGGLFPMPMGGLGDYDVKLHSDRYQVFVNGDKVGNKELLTQVDNAHDLESYLTENGFSGFDYKVTGCHIEIDTKEDADHMKEILSSYLSIK